MVVKLCNIIAVPGEQCDFQIVRSGLLQPSVTQGGDAPRGAILGAASGARTEAATGGKHQVRARAERTYGRSSWHCAECDTVGVPVPFAANTCTWLPPPPSCPLIPRLSRHQCLSPHSWKRPRHTNALCPHSWKRPRHINASAPTAGSVHVIPISLPTWPRLKAPHPRINEVERDVRISRDASRAEMVRSHESSPLSQL